MSRQDDINTARKKGLIAAAATAGAATLVVASPVLGVVAGVGAAYLGYDWFKYRAKRGMRF